INFDMRENRTTLRPCRWANENATDSRRCGDELADGRESSLLSSVESAAARARLRRLRRSAMCRLLRRPDGPPQLAPRDRAARLSRPGAAGGAARSLDGLSYASPDGALPIRLLRRHRLRARDRLSEM